MTKKQWKILFYVTVSVFGFICYLMSSEIEKLREEKRVLQDNQSKFEEEKIRFKEMHSPDKGEPVEWLLPFQEGLQTINKRDYVEKKYTCFDFSRDLRENLLKNGIPSKIDIVKTGKPKEPVHAVVSVQIEPQSGQVVFYDNSQLIDQCYLNHNDKYLCRKGYVEQNIGTVDSNSDVYHYKKNGVSLTGE